MAATPANQLLEEAKCYTCLGVSLAESLKLALLSRIAVGEGFAASGDFQSADYGGAEPNWTPTGTLGIAVDTSTERVWWYYSGAWH